MNKLLKTCTIIMLVLFCWIIYPVKWIKKMKFVYDRKNAIGRANVLHQYTGKKYHVMQNGRSFYVGSRIMLRSINIEGKKALKYTGCKFDYRNAIIYSTNERTIRK